MIVSGVSRTSTDHRLISNAVKSAAAAVCITLLVNICVPTGPFWCSKGIKSSDSRCLLSNSQSCTRDPNYSKKAFHLKVFECLRTVMKIARPNKYVVKSSKKSEQPLSMIWSRIKIKDHNFEMLLCCCRVQD